MSANFIKLILIGTPGDNVMKNTTPMLMHLGKAKACPKAKGKTPKAWASLRPMSSATGVASMVTLQPIVPSSQPRGRGEPQLAGVVVYRGTRIGHAPIWATAQQKG